jgi:hypothetical protein
MEYLGRVARELQHHQLELDQMSGYHQRIEGGEENTLSFGGVAVLSNVYFEAKARKVTVYKGKSFGQGITGGKGEGAIVNI